MHSLSNVNALVVSQRKEWGEILTGFETRNKYVVLDAEGNELYKAAEHAGSTLARIFLKAYRPFEMSILRLDGNTVLRLSRPFRFYFHEISVFDAGGTCAVNGWAPSHVIKGENPWSYEGEHPNMYQVEHNELFAAIRGGTTINDGRWMTQSTMMAILGRMAAYSGQTVSWEQAMNSAEDWTPPVYTLGELDMPPVAVPGVYKVPAAAS